MKNKLRRNSFLIFLIATLLISFLYGAGWFQGIENRSIDLRFRKRGFEPPKSPIVIAAIDDESLQTVSNWPWPRKIHAQLIDICRRAGAKTVVYDVLFLERDRYDATNDQKLSEALRKSGSVVSSYDFKYVEEDVVEQDGHAAQAKVESYIVKEDPIAPVAKSSAKLGFVNTWTDQDGYSRWATLDFEFEGEHYYPLNVQAAALVQNKSAEDILKEVPSLSSQDWGQATKKVLVNWRGDETVFEVHSIAKILDNGVPMEWKTDWLKGKIVIVGSTALGLYDHYPTPFSPSFPGLYFHANVIDNLMSNEFLKPVSGIVTYILIVLLGLAGCALVLGTNLWIGAASSLLITALYWFAGYLLMSKKLVCIELTAPIVSILGNYIAVFFYRFIVEQREKAGIKKAFGVYVNPHVVDQIAKNPDALKLGGEMRDMTVMFSDIAGFTTISEKLSPQELVSLLNIYLTAMTDTIMRFDGTVDKYEGDAIMAFWGAPLEQPKHARQACLAVLENRERLKQLNVELEQKGMNKLFARCGLNTGPMNVGNMGSSQKFNYTVMGDTVNLASRLEGANKEYGSALMVSESTYNACKDDIEVRELDLLRVKGKKIPIKVYELVCHKGGLTDAQKKGFEVYLEALGLFRGRKFKEALKKFQSVDEFLKDDPPSATYIGRCKDYIEKPPEKDWDGVHVMTTK